MTSWPRVTYESLMEEYRRVMAQRENEMLRLRINNIREGYPGTVTGRLWHPEPYVVDRPPPMHREMVVDGIPSSRVNAEGLSTNTHQPMVCIKDEEECAEHCGTCSFDAQYNKDYWASKEMYWNSQMHEFGVEWDPDIVF